MLSIRYKQHITGHKTHPLRARNHLRLDPKTDCKPTSQKKSLDVDKRKTDVDVSIDANEKKVKRLQVQLVPTCAAIVSLEVKSAA
eukprot:2381-Hanusia_phi.AAC.1